MRRTPLHMVVASVVLVACFCVLLLMTFEYCGPRIGDIGAAVIERGAGDTGAANLITAIYLGYRLYDTLFEILIFALAVLGVRFYLVKEEEEAAVTPSHESQVVRTSADLLFAPALLFGIYLSLFGHISPGGGFSGGAVAGTALLLCAIARGTDLIARRLHETIVKRFEWGILLTIFLIALVPFFLGKFPLTDLLPAGRAGEMLSGGSIIVYNMLIGAKVFIGTWVIVDSFIRHRGEE